MTRPEVETMTISHEQIEARAFELFQTRRENRARNQGQSAADRMKFEGAELDLCFSSARETLEIEAHDAAIKTAEDRWYEDQFAAMSNADIENEIARIDREASLLPYASLRVNIAVVGAGLKNERRRLVAEQFRRSISTPLPSLEADAMEAAQ